MSFMMSFAYSLAKATTLLCCLFCVVVHGFSIINNQNGAMSGRAIASSALSMATWSNGQAVQDYQNFLKSGKQELDITVDIPSCVVISKTDDFDTYRLASAVVQMGSENDIVLTTDEPLPDEIQGNSQYPIYVTLPPRQLDEFLTTLPESWIQRAEDFVFFSGGLVYGNIEDILKDRGFCRDQMTQVLISGLEITENGQLKDLSVSLGPDESGVDRLAGECAACGKWAGSIASRLDKFNVLCRVDFYREWRRRMWEQSVAEAVLNVVGAIRDEQPTTIANVAQYYKDEVSDIVWEFSQLLRGWKAITLTYGFESRIFAVAEARGVEKNCELKDEMFPYIWGNPVFLQSKGFNDYLNYAQSEKGLLQGITLPRKSDDDFKSAMRQGNLRADGVV